LNISGSNIECVEVTEEAVLGMSSPNFSYAEVQNLLGFLPEFDGLIDSLC